MVWSTSTSWLVPLVPLAIGTAVIVQRVIQDRIERNGHPLPPGPIPLPLLGSVFSINNELPWLTYTAWRTKYGDIMYIRLLDTDVIVLNSVTVANELLERRSRIYADRPFVSTRIPYGHDFDFALMPYGEHWRLCRRIFQQTFRANSALALRPMQLRRARQLVLNVIDNPDEYRSHFATFATAISMSAVYDYEPSSRDDPMVSIVSNFLRTAMPGLKPEKILLLKAFPFLMNIPDWLPGSWMKREAQEAYVWRTKMIERPYMFVQKRMSSGDYMNTGMVPDHIVRMEKFDVPYRSEYEKALKHASASTLLASGDTTSTILMTFTLAMVQNPHVWKRAQATIDAVVGTDRFPEFADRSSMPYIDAIIRETLRWRPVSPLGMPYAAMQSDIYEGYHIPQGASVIVNVWGIAHDETRYPSADKFIPERFLDAQGTLTADDPGEFIFGYGRRKCPGRYTGDASIWSAVVMMLATLDFNFAKDMDGNDMTFEATFTSGMSEHPNPFPCQITPRPHISKDTLERDDTVH